MKIQGNKCFVMMVIGILVASAGIVHAATTTITASATIQTATITLTPVTDVDFGTIVSTGLSNILIDASSGAAVSTVDSGLASITAAGTSGRIDVLSPVSATVNIIYAIADSTAAADQIDDGGGNSMPLTAASIHTYSTGGAPGTLALTAGVASPLHIGGLLQVANGQAVGAYSGTITVTVNY